MDDREQLEALLELAHELELEVRIAGRTEAAPQQSGLCRVRGRVWVVLSTADPIEHQLQALAGGLRAACGEALEGRFLPPALRSRIFPDPEAV